MWTNPDPQNEAPEDKGFLVSVTLLTGVKMQWEAPEFRCLSFSLMQKMLKWDSFSARASDQTQQRWAFPESATIRYQTLSTQTNYPIYISGWLSHTPPNGTGLTLWQRLIQCHTTLSLGGSSLTQHTTHLAKCTTVASVATILWQVNTK